jgi:hypothetical protein
MHDHPLLSAFVARVQAALPVVERLEVLLAELTETDGVPLAQYLAAPSQADQPLAAPSLAAGPGGLDVLLAMPGSLSLARPLAALLEVPLVEISGQEGSLKLAYEGLQERPSALLVGLELTSGLPELEVTLLAQGLGSEVQTLACLLERSTAQGRHRLLQLGVKTHAALQIAFIPASAMATGGWILERRGPKDKRTTV